ALMKNETAVIVNGRSAMDAMSGIGNFRLGSVFSMRILCLIVLVVVTLLEIGPIPISGLLLIWVVLFRPVWFYELVAKIYGRK
ncbi:MAG: hypothetical protein Q8N96_05985, partial [Methylovulum sp.]|nr:hypothetical protein [Methylovulum sp.]